MKKTLMLLFATLMIFGCSKDEPIPKPTAEFTYSLGANGYITFTNVSTNANTYKWDFGDNGTTTEKSPFYVYKANNTFQVSLTATGAGGSDVIVKSITINNIVGSLLVYKKNSSGRSPILVYIDDVYKGVIVGDYYYTSSPGCGNTNSVTATNLTAGVHYVKASETSGTGTWSGTVNITGGICNSIALN